MALSDYQNLYLAAADKLKKKPTAEDLTAGAVQTQTPMGPVGNVAQTGQADYAATQARANQTLQNSPLATGQTLASGLRSADLASSNLQRGNIAGAIGSGLSAAGSALALPFSAAKDLGSAAVQGVTAVGDATLRAGGAFNEAAGRLAQGFQGIDSSAPTPVAAPTPQEMAAYRQQVAAGGGPAASPLAAGLDTGSPIRATTEQAVRAIRNAPVLETPNAMTLPANRPEIPGGAALARGLAIKEPASIVPVGSAAPSEEVFPRAGSNLPSTGGRVAAPNVAPGDQPYKLGGSYLSTTSGSSGQSSNLQFREISGDQTPSEIAANKSYNRNLQFLKSLEEQTRGRDIGNQLGVFNALTSARAQDRQDSLIPYEIELRKAQAEGARANALASGANLGTRQERLDLDRANRISQARKNAFKTSSDAGETTRPNEEEIIRGFSDAELKSYNLQRPPALAQPDQTSYDQLKKDIVADPKNKKKYLQQFRDIHGFEPPSSAYKK